MDNTNPWQSYILYKYARVESISVNLLNLPIWVSGIRNIMSVHTDCFSASTDYVRLNDTFPLAFVARCFSKKWVRE